jgi:outer membrane lipoprotein LolB
MDRSALWMVCVGFCTVLLGCATPPPQPSEPLAPPAATVTPAAPVLAAHALSGQWDGRLSLKLAAFGGETATGLTMAFELEVQGQSGTLNLSTPMGTRVAAVHWQPGQSGARLETSEGPQQFESLDSLTHQILGEALPLDAMLYWLDGQPAPALPYERLAATPGVFEQAGWQVDATQLSQGRLDATRPGTDTQRGVTLRLRLDL